jgi:hypothetical protein
MWSWWDSNPRPNKESIGFLRAYHFDWFSILNRPKAANPKLSFFIFG